MKSERLNSTLLKKLKIKTKKTNTKEKINTNRSSLDLTLKKINKRIALIKTKLVKVNELSTNITNITLLV